MVWDTILKREDIETHCLLYIRDSFRAAAESPCGNGVIHDTITFSGLSPEATSLLSGIIPPEWYGDNAATRSEFLAYFTIPPSVKEKGDISTEISEDVIRRSFKSWSESTSTSLSGWHLMGHYKAVIQHPVLLTCFCKFLNIATERGITILRWCNATNVLIKKDKDSPRINCLCIIHLFEADLNFFLKLQWGSRLVRRAS